MIISILKIIGWAVLIILLIILFLLLIVLTVPVCYRLDISRYGKTDGNVRVTFVPLGFCADVSYKDDKLQYVVRVLGGVVMTNTQVKLSWLGRKWFPDIIEDVEVEEHTETAQKENTEESTVPVIQTKTEYTMKTDEYEKDNNISESAGRQEYRTEHNKRTSILEHISNGIQNIRDHWKRLVRGCSNIQKKKDALLKVYHSKRFELAKDDLMRYTKQFFRIIKPSRLEGRVHFGLDDPAYTGQLLGGLAWIYPLYQKYLTIEPDFENACLEGYLKGKGKIFLGSICKLALQVVFNKNLIKVTKKVQTIIEA